MQCNAMQSNAMQCNVMQCMYGCLLLFIYLLVRLRLILLVENRRCIEAVYGSSKGFASCTGVEHNKQNGWVSMLLPWLRIPVPETVLQDDSSRSWCMSIYLLDCFSDLWCVLSVWQFHSESMFLHMVKTAMWRVSLQCSKCAFKWSDKC